jgi:hypothetical protein
MGEVKKSIARGFIGVICGKIKIHFKKTSKF